MNQGQREEGIESERDVSCHSPARLLYISVLY